MNKLQMFLIGFVVLIAISGGVFMVMNLLKSTSDNIQIRLENKTIASKNVDIEIFTPAVSINQNNVPLVPLGNSFDSNVIWFYAKINNITTEKYEQSHYFSYEVYLTILDEKSNVVLGFNKIPLHNVSGYTQDKLESDIFKFNLRTNLFRNGKYTIKLMVYDIISKTSDEQINYFMLAR